MDQSGKDAIVEKARSLGPNDRAALVVISESQNIIVEDHRGGDWWDIIGLFGAGTAYCQSEMKLP